MQSIRSTITADLLTRIWLPFGAVGGLGLGLGLLSLDLLARTPLVVGLHWAVSLLLPLCLGWGLWQVWLMHQELQASELASREKGRLLSVRNSQLRMLLEASRTMSCVLDLDEVLKTVVNQVVQNTRFSQASIILGPNEFGEFRMAAGRGLLNEHVRFSAEVLSGPLRAYAPVEWSRLSMAPVIIENMAADPRVAPIRHLFLGVGVGALVTSPLTVGDRFIGALTVYLDRRTDFTPEEISLLQALTAQAAMAVENARLFTLTQTHHTRQARAMAFLEEVSAALAQSRVGVQPLLVQVAGATARLFSPSSVTVSIYHEGTGRSEPLSVVETAGLDSLAEHTAPWRRALCLPIVLEGERLGHFEIFMAGEGRLDIEETSILQAFVHLTALALGNAHLVADLRRAVDEVERAWMGTLEALTSALETRDDEIQGHARRVVEYTLVLAQRMGVAEDQLVPIIRGALLHDIGKIGIPDSILLKAGPLNEQEWAVMRTHSQLGYKMLRNVTFLQDSLPVVLHHHERYDGSGYPDGLTGDTIPLGARIFAVADAYDAITSDRPYRKAASHADAVAEISRSAGSHFDPAVVQALVSLPAEELLRIRHRELELRDCPAGPLVRG